MWDVRVSVNFRVFIYPNLRFTHLYAFLQQTFPPKIVMDINIYTIVCDAVSTFTIRMRLYILCWIWDYCLARSHGCVRSSWSVYRTDSIWTFAAKGDADRHIGLFYNCVATQSVCLERLFSIHSIRVLILLDFIAFVHNHIWQREIPILSRGARCYR
jgi:hypothetical protein